jgi:putative transposase
MARALRLVVPEFAHHVRERGVRKGPIFYDDSDHLVYTRVLKEACAEHGMTIGAYCLMTNHVHLVAVPETGSSISKALHLAHTAYARYFNSKYGFVGHVWQARPDITVMDEAHTLNAIRYVERNPVRAGMVTRAEDYLWSSAAAHCGLRDDILFSGSFLPDGLIPNWSEWLRIDHTELEMKTIRHHTKTGKPWGTPEFLLQLESLTGRNLQPRNVGRPRAKNRGHTTD